jgi:S1-C subfamily serine protease
LLKKLENLNFNIVTGGELMMKSFKNQSVKYILVALLSFLIGGWCFAGLLADQVADRPDSNVAQASLPGSRSVADIVETVGPAVVYIEATGSRSMDRTDMLFYGFRIPPTPYTATGTGFVIDANGYILTNQHVIDGASSIKVTVQGKETPYTATVVGSDYDLDLAVLKIEANNLQTIPMGDSDLMRPGDTVIAIGNPLGLDHSVTTGVVSAKGRPITVGNRNYKNLIQTDAAINSGNSGGPLINLQGQVIAINTAVSATGQNIGFAIPINTAKSILQELMTTGKVVRPYLGISMVDVTAEVAEQLQLSRDTRGVAIAYVVPGSPAAQAGGKAYDVLVSIDGKAVEKASAVQEYIQSQKVGQTVQLGILRSGRNMTIAVTLREKP